MKRYTTINGTDFRIVKDIPCSRDLRGRVLSDVYNSPSHGKARAFNAWEAWKREVNEGDFARITDMYISGYNCQRFTLIFKGYTLPDGCLFTLAVTGVNEYIKYGY